MRALSPAGEKGISAMKKVLALMSGAFPFRVPDRTAAIRTRRVTPGQPAGAL
uniref:Uncharacterized protein n=1 Tax=uncultured bacterium Contig575 TaxID=1393592 RepID=W0FMX8_9BACT|nr:hypothetical protein [uncultured bacterium Contig575]